MIPANELRVGNLVKKGKMEYVADYLTIHMAHNYQPIPLTRELIEKAGFEYLDKDDLGGWTKYIKRRSVVCSDVTITFGSACENVYVNHSNNGVAYCLYLHQLQNLYFALTGEELYPAKKCDATAAEERIFAALKKKYRISTDY